MATLSICIFFMAILARSDDLPDSPRKIRPLLIGSTVPELTLKNLDDSDFDLNAAIAQKPTILIFYRGGW